jgi:hypothetical protein
MWLLLLLLQLSLLLPIGGRQHCMPKFVYTLTKSTRMPSKQVQHKSSCQEKHANIWRAKQASHLLIPPTPPLLLVVLALKHPEHAAEGRGLEGFEV